jgi:hypothetical protein
VTNDAPHILVFLSVFRPSEGTLAWELIQATGQTLIVFAAILTVFVEALHVSPLLLHHTGPQPAPRQRSRPFEMYLEQLVAVEEAARRETTRDDEARS